MSLAELSLTYKVTSCGNVEVLVNLLLFSETILAGNQALHQLQIARVEPQGRIHPDRHDIEQFGEIDAMHPPPGRRQRREPIAAARPLLDERGDAGFPLPV